jgi:hypothetical protein
MNTAELQAFHNDLRAAVRAGVKLEIGDSDSIRKPLNLRELERLEEMAANGKALPERYQAAIETWKETGSMIPVLEGLSTRIGAWRRIRKLFRKSLIYVFALAVLATAALVWFQIKILPEINAIREDLMTVARPIDNIKHSSVGFWANVILVLFALTLSALIWWLLRGGISRAGWWTGMSNWLHYNTLATASRTLQTLVAEGMDPEHAARLSGTLTGLGPEGQGELLCSIRGIDKRTILSLEWSDYLRMMAEQQYVTARTWGPGTLVVVVGGLFTLLYVVLAYWPITSLLFDLSIKTQI